jgi:hypothetical protein
MESPTFLMEHYMCKEDKQSGLPMACYILSRVEAGDVPQYLVLGWHSAVLMGSWHKTFSEYIAEAYRGYVEGCSKHPPKPIGEWMLCAERLWQKTYEASGADWIDRRKEKAVMTTSEEEQP